MIFYTLVYSTKGINSFLKHYTELHVTTMPLYQLSYTHSCLWFMLLSPSYTYTHTHTHTHTQLLKFNSWVTRDEDHPFEWQCCCPRVSWSPAGNVSLMGILSIRAPHSLRNFVWFCCHITLDLLDRKTSLKCYDVKVQGVGLGSLTPTPFIRNRSSAHSQMHTLVITHAGYRSAWHGSYDHPLPVPGF